VGDGSAAQADIIRAAAQQATFVHNQQQSTAAAGGGSNNNTISGHKTLPGERPPSLLALSAGVGAGPALDPRLGSVLGASLAPERQEAVRERGR